MAGLPSLVLHDLQLAPGRSLALLIENVRQLEWAGASDKRGATRAVLKVLASHLKGLPPHTFEFEQTASGKPYFRGVGSIAFNVSHSRQHTLIALSAAGEIGCDVEDRFVTADVRSLGALVLHPAELEAMQSLDEQEQLRALMRYWVRKEAALKAFGSGFLEDPRQLVVGIDDAAVRRMTQDGKLLKLHNPPPHADCLAAVASLDAACEWYRFDLS